MYSFTFRRITRHAVRLVTPIDGERAETTKSGVNVDCTVEKKKKRKSFREKEFVYGLPPLSMSGSNPPTKTFREKHSVNWETALARDPDK